MANFIITATDQTGRPTTFTVDATDIRDATIKGSQNPLVRMGLVAITSVNPATIPPVMNNQQMMNVPSGYRGDTPISQIQDWEREFLPPETKTRKQNKETNNVNNTGSTK